jgi:hypothetical protein
MPPYGLYSLANTPEELLLRGYGQDVLRDYDPAFGRLKTVQRYQPAPFTGARPFQKMYDIAPYTDTGTDLGFNADLYNPSFGGISGYRNVGGIDTLPEMDPSRFTGVDLESGYLDRAGSYGQDVYAEQEKQKGGGIGGLFKFLLGLAVPGAGLLMNLPKRGLEGIRSLNQRIQNTDFGQSRTGAEYMMKRRERKQAERAQEAMPDVYRSAKEQGFTNDRGGFSTNRADRAGTSLGSGQFSPSTSRGRSGY